jgi:quercetin dioxygenase-like cupin family protein
MTLFDDLGAIGPVDIWDGVRARIVDGDRCSFAIVELAPGSVVREHAHPNEQLGMVVAGQVSFRIADETRELGPGGTWRIPSDMPHEVHVGTEGAVVIDLFAPARADWQALERSDPVAPRWP